MVKYITKPANLGSYLAGLWEGDGHIWVPTTTNAPSGKNTHHTLQPLLLKLIYL